MNGGKRISKELAELTTSPPKDMKVELANEDNLYEWKVTLDGPEGSPYENGRFIVNISLPTSYPFKPPTVSFATKIYHPNIDSEKGTMCLGMLRADEWKPSSKLAAVLEFVRQLLVEPMADDAIEAQIAEKYKTDRKEYNAIARQFVKAHASKQ